MATVSPSIYAHDVPPFSSPHIPREYAYNIPPSYETMPVLTEAFSLLRHDWIRQFLFTSDPVEITTLTSLNASFAVNAIFLESSIGRSFSSTETFPATVEGETVLVPAFSIGRYTAGVGIKRRTSDIPTNVDLMPWTGFLTSEHLRFIADNETGTYTVFRKSRQLPFFFVEVFELTSPVHRKRNLFTFHVSKLFDLVRRYDMHSFPLVAHQALAMVQVVSEARECNICGTAVVPQCRCPPKTVVPNHPLDFDAMKKNLMSHFGAFQGVETLNMYTAGAQVASAELGARFSVSLDMDPKTTQRLIHWAINDRIVGECAGPMRQLTPVCNDDTEGELFGYFGDLDNLDEEEEVMTTHVKPEAKQFEAGSVVRRMRSSSPSDDSWRRGRGSTEASEGRAETPDTPSTPSQDGEKGDAVIVLVDPEKLAKMRTRREKNREAARKSNQIKKRKNEHLRDQLTDSLDRMTELQAKEAALRTENSRLRKLVSGK